MRFSLRDFRGALTKVPWRRPVSPVFPDTLRRPGAWARFAAVAVVALGAASIEAQGTPNLVSVTHAQLVVPAGYSCQIPPPADTIATPLHATLRGTRPSGMQDTAWLRYQRAVLEAVRRALVLPNDIRLAAFSSPFPMPASARRPSADAAPPPQDDKRRAATITRFESDSTDDVQGGRGGVLLDQEDNQPVPYATVSLPEAWETRLTDSTGAWRINRIARGRYSLHVRRIGYTAKDTVVVIGAATPARIDTIHISRAPVRLRRVTVDGKRPSTYVTLMLSTVVAITLDSEGSLRDAHVAASSASGPADTIVVASLRRAGTTDFPTLPEDREHTPVTFDLVISMDEPRPEEESIVVGRVEGAVWATQDQAYLDAAAHPDLLSGLAPKDRVNDITTLQFVVDTSGHIITSTARSPETHPEPVGYHPRPFEALVRESLSQFHFTPARVGACAVPQLVTQSFVLNVK
jgi:hypothetical protein